LGVEQNGKVLGVWENKAGFAAFITALENFFCEKHPLHLVV